MEEMHRVGRFSASSVGGNGQGLGGQVALRRASGIIFIVPLPPNLKRRTPAWMSPSRLRRRLKNKASLCHVGSSRHPRQLLTKHLLEEKQQRRQCLAMCRGRHMALDRQPRQKRLNLLTAHPLGMPKTMKVHRCTNPMDVGLFGGYAVLKVANLLTDPVRQAQPRWRCDNNAGARGRIQVRRGRRWHDED